MIKTSRYRLGNGLQVVHSRNCATGMAAVNLLYRVGAKNESPEYTGLAHLCEHLMFGGTAAVPKFDSVMVEAGGDNNAWTNSDITNYYDILPFENVETAFWVEADRMQNLLLSDKSVEVQRSVVQEEFKQRCLNAPYGDVGHILREMVYKVHPYKWPVIGKALSDIENVPVEAIKAFYRRYYNPGNAILSVVGNLDSEDVFALAEKWFAGIPCAEMPERTLPCEPTQLSAREKEVERDVPHNMIVKAYRMCGRLDNDYPVCDLLSDVLSNGRSSRLFRNVYAKGNLVASIDASITGDEDPGMLIVKAQLLPGVSFDRVEAAIADELRKVADGDVSQYELDKVVNKYESNALFSNLNNDELASNLAYFEMLGNAEMINEEVERYRATTLGRMADVASVLFAESNCSTLYYKARNS